VFGNCFLTKMTNPRDAVGIPKEFKRKGVKYTSYAILPFKYFDGDYYRATKKGKIGKIATGDGLTLTQFGYVPVASLNKLMEGLKF